MGSDVEEKSNSWWPYLDISMDYVQSMQLLEAQADFMQCVFHEWSWNESKWTAMFPDF